MSVRDGKLYVPEFFNRQKGEGVFAEQVAKMFEISCRKNGIDKNRVNLSTEKFNNPYKKQLELF